MLFRPLFMQPAVGDEFEYSANELRTFVGLLFNTEGVGNTNGPATFANNDLKVSQRSAGANMSVDVLGGFAVILGDDVTFQGFYACWSSATENLVVPAPPAAGSRIHRVIARVKDKLHEASWSTYEWTLEVLEDTDGSGPPALPDSAISLATVTVNAGDTAVTDSAIADTRQAAVMGSGMTAGRYVASASARPANPHESEIIWRADLEDYEVYTGSEWRLLGLSRPAARLGRTTANQSIPHNTATALAWNAESEDTHNAHDNLTNASRFTAPVAGLYLVTATVTWNGNSTGTRQIGVRVNGTTTYSGERIGVDGASITFVQSISRMVRLAAGDYVEAVVVQTSGGALDVDRTFESGPGMEICWMRP